MWPFDDEEDQTQAQPPLALPAQPPIGLPPMGLPEPAPMNPQVKDYILNKFSPENRQAIETQNADDRSGPNWLAGLASFGAGLQGRDSVAAGQSFLANQEKGRQGKLDSFDKNRAVALQDVNDKDMLAKRDRENDPNSNESKIAQDLAIKFGMKPDQAATLTAAKFKDVSPSLAKMYEIQEANRNKSEDRAFKKDLVTATRDAKQTPGQKALDTSFAKEYNDWSSGGEASVDKNLVRLKDARDKLEKSKDDLIGPTGGIVGRLPDWARSEASKTIQQDVQAAAQGALKATLGAQFTEREGERIMRMAYDPTLSPEANIKKIDAAIAELETGKLAKNAKAQHFDDYGTLKGLSGKDIPKSMAADKKIVKQFVSRSSGKTKNVYDDGTEEIVDTAVANNGQN